MENETLKSMCCIIIFNDLVKIQTKIYILVVLKGKDYEMHLRFKQEHVQTKHFHAQSPSYVYF